jgi:tRNA(Glu) U13 pseudouridine synthase TruD
VKLLTEKDVEGGKYCINDVIIPLFGSDVKYPENKTGQFLKQLLKNEGIDEECLLKFRPM